MATLKVAPYTIGQFLSACEQVIMATKFSRGLNSSSYFFEKPFMGSFPSAYLTRQTGFALESVCSISNPV